MSEGDGIGTVDDLHAAATKITGLAAFGADDYRDGLAVLRALHRQSTGAARPAHHYALSDFGLTGEQVDERFAGYLNAYA